MRAFVIVLKDTNKHSLYDIITGQVSTSLATCSQTFNPQNFPSTGFDVLLQAKSGNTGNIVYGDGTVTATDPNQILQGDSSFLPGKIALPGIFLLATSANDVVEVSYGEGIG